MYTRFFLLFCLFTSCSLRPMLKTAASFIPLAINVSMKYIPGAKDTLSQVLPTIAINSLHYPINKTTVVRWTTTPWPILGTLMFCNPYISQAIMSNGLLANRQNRTLYKIVIPLGITLWVIFNTLYPLYRNAELNRMTCSKAFINYLLLYGPPIVNLWLY